VPITSGTRHEDEFGTNGGWPAGRTEDHILKINFWGRVRRYGLATDPHTSSLVGVNTASRPDVRWLNDKEMRAWRSYIVGSAMLECRLHRELQDGHGLALADYEILVRLSEQPERRMRMSQLATEVASSKSRVSHQVARLEAAGLVQRGECPSDGRGVFAHLTEKGWDLLQRSAPTHVQGVREHLIDLMSTEEQEVLARVFERVITHLRGTSC